MRVMTANLWIEKKKNINIKINDKNLKGHEMKVVIVRSQEISGMFATS